MCLGFLASANGRGAVTKAWQEGGRLPSFILEMTSRSTPRQDDIEKSALYAQLGSAGVFSVRLHRRLSQAAVVGAAAIKRQV